MQRPQCSLYTNDQEELQYLRNENTRLRLVISEMQAPPRKDTDPDQLIFKLIAQHDIRTNHTNSILSLVRELNIGQLREAYTKMKLIEFIDDRVRHMFENVTLWNSRMTDQPWNSVAREIFRYYADTAICMQRLQKNIIAEIDAKQV